MQKARGKLENPAVLGAVLHLGNCFDLLDTRYTKVLASVYPTFKTEMATRSSEVPSNEPAGPEDSDKLIRKLDSAVLNWTIEKLSEEFSSSIDSVRCVFQEGNTAYPGSAIHMRSHIQIAVRNPACILGYFRVPSE